MHQMHAYWCRHTPIWKMQTVISQDSKAKPSYYPSAINRHRLCKSSHCRSWSVDSSDHSGISERSSALLGLFRFSIPMWFTRREPHEREQDLRAPLCPPRGQSARDRAISSFELPVFSEPYEWVFVSFVTIELIRLLFRASSTETLWYLFT